MTELIPNSIRPVSKSGPVCLCLFLFPLREETSFVTTSDTEDIVHSRIKTEPLTLSVPTTLQTDFLLFIVTEVLHV